MFKKKKKLKIIIIVQLRLVFNSENELYKIVCHSTGNLNNSCEIGLFVGK